MSPLWNNTLSLQVDTQQLRATFYPGWLQRQGWVRPHAGNAQALRQPLAISSERLQPLPGALDALFSEVHQQCDIRNARLHVTLADAHVHFDVASGHFASYGQQQLQAIAMGCVAELLGDAAANQAVRWQLQPDLQHLLLCAMEQPMVDAIVQAADQHGLHLDSLQPAFCRQWGQHSGALPLGSGVFTLADTGYSLIACALRGSITALSLGRWNASWPAGAQSTPPGQTLDMRVNRLLASLGAQAPDGFVLVTRDAATLAPTPRWTVCEWQEESP